MWLLFYKSIKKQFSVYYTLIKTLGMRNENTQEAGNHFATGHDFLRFSRNIKVIL